MKRVFLSGSNKLFNPSTSQHSLFNMLLTVSPTGSPGDPSTNKYESIWDQLLALNNVLYVSPFSSSSWPCHVYCVFESILLIRNLKWETRPLHVAYIKGMEFCCPVWIPAAEHGLYPWSSHSSLWILNTGSDWLILDLEARGHIPSIASFVLVWDSHP